LNGKDTWQDYCAKIDRRTLEITPKIDEKKAHILQAQILKLLTKAHNEEKLKTKIQEIRSLLKLEQSTQHGEDIVEILGGQRNFKRLKS
jgi:hypothetical protein